jgi:hypothetical protein
MVILLSAAGCGWKQKLASSACVKTGYGPDHSQHQECISNTLAANEAQRQADLQAMGAIAGVVGGAYAYFEAVPSTTVYSAPKPRMAPLVGRDYLDGKHICTYHTPQGNMSVIPVGGQMCPDHYAY